jgi:hypothetical protein
MFTHSVLSGQEHYGAMPVSKIEANKLISKKRIWYLSAKFGIYKSYPFGLAALWRLL